eukprot:1466470-Karenia_brevis.AAC.1
MILRGSCGVRRHSELVGWRGRCAATYSLDGRPLGCSALSHSLDERLGAPSELFCATHSLDGRLQGGSA